VEQGGGEADVRWWWAALAGCLVLVAVPFFVIDVPPLLDYPNHLARLYVLAHVASDPVLGAMYAPHWSILPNLGLDIVGVPLVKLLPVHVAGRILLYAAALMPTIGVIVYHRALFVRRSYGPLAATAFAFNAIFFAGFAAFLYGVGLALIGAALWIRWRERELAVRVAATVATGIVLFFCHMLALFYFLVLVVAHEAAAAWPLDVAGRRRALESLGILAGGLLPTLLLYGLSPFAGDTGASIWQYGNKLTLLLTPFMTYSQWVTVGSALVLAALVAVCALRGRWIRIDRGALLAVVLVLAVYAVAPSRMHGGAVIDARLPLLALLTLAGGIGVQVSRRSALVLGAVVAALIVVRTGSVSASWAEHRQDLAAFRSAIAPVMPGERVLVVSGTRAAHSGYFLSEPRSRMLPGFYYRLDEHLPALLVIERHAFWPYLFADPRQQPITVRPPYAAIAWPLGEPPAPADIATDDGPGAYLSDWPAHFDYVLLLDAGAIDASKLRPDRLQPIVRTDAATLYRVRKG